MSDGRLACLFWSLSKSCTHRVHRPNGDASCLLTLCFIRPVLGALQLPPMFLLFLFVPRGWSSNSRLCRAFNDHTGDVITVSLFVAPLSPYRIEKILSSFSYERLHLSSFLPPFFLPIAPRAPVPKELLAFPLRKNTLRFCYPLSQWLYYPQFVMKILGCLAIRMVCFFVRAGALFGSGGLAVVQWLMCFSKLFYHPPRQTSPQMFPPSV